MCIILARGVHGWDAATCTTALQQFFHINHLLILRLMNCSCITLALQLFKVKTTSHNILELKLLKIHVGKTTSKKNTFFLFYGKLHGLLVERAHPSSRNRGCKWLPLQLENTLITHSGVICVVRFEVGLSENGLSQTIKSIKMNLIQLRQSDVSCVGGLL